MILKIQSEKTGKVLAQCDMQNCALDGFTEFVEKWGLENRVDDLIVMNMKKHPELVLVCKYNLQWPA